MGFKQDDSDMKIFTTSQRTLEFAEAEKIVAELERQRQNGNLGKARRLGQTLADEIAKLGNGSVFDGLLGTDAQSKTVKQRKILLAFAIESSIAVYSPSKLIGTATLNTYYEVLSQQSPEFYESISASGAFSVYYLDLRRGIKVSRAIGKTFARLCGEEGNPVYEELGYALNCSFYDTVRDMVEKSGFTE